MGAPTDTPTEDRAPARHLARRSHPGTAPTVITLALVGLVMGLGWLSRGSVSELDRPGDPPAESGAGGQVELGTEAGPAGAPPDAPTTVGGEGGGISAARSFVPDCWLDIPLVRPTALLQPGALGTIIPGTPTAPGEGQAGSGTGTGGPAAPGTTAPGAGGPAGTTTTAPGTATTAPGAGPSTTAPAGGEAPPRTTTTAPTTTAPPATTTTTRPSGLLDAVGGLLGGVVGLLDG